MFRRVIWIVLDSVGIDAIPDARTLRPPRASVDSVFQVAAAKSYAGCTLHECMI